MPHLGRTVARPHRPITGQSVGWRVWFAEALQAASFTLE